MLFANAEMQEILELWANDLLTWIGFGTLVGLMAKAIMPGRDPGGSIATLLMGIGGSIIGCGTLMFFYNGERVTPISPVGFLVATGGAFILLLFYRLLSGRFFLEGERPRRAAVRAPHRRRRETVAEYDDV
jgi:uncharacterized membrane protein YeaQ/YmgE (transglycosylase-associated protein family)